MKRFQTCILSFVFLSSATLLAMVPDPYFGPMPDKLLLEEEVQKDHEALTGKLLEMVPTDASEDFVNWQNKNYSEDKFEGTSLLKLYKDAGTSLFNSITPVVVAVIDGGVDIKHDYIKDHVWTDIATGDHGRNFLGNSDGVNINCTTLELTREYVKCNNGTVLNTDPSYCTKVRQDFSQKKEEAAVYAPEQNLVTIKKYLDKAKELVTELGVKDMNYDDAINLNQKIRHKRKQEKDL